MKQTLWTREFTRITAATALGAAGGIISQFALSFLVFDETGSTLAAALVVAIQLIPMVLLPLVVAPMMDRLPRKPFLVWGDLLNGVCYAGAGLFLLHSSFSYIAYLAFSLLVSCLGAFDELAYNSFYPLLLPKGQEERAYTVSAMLYPILKVLMMPLAAVLYEMEQALQGLPERRFLTEYRSRSCLIGQTVELAKDDGTVKKVAVLEIADDCGLVVRDSFGNVETLHAGEVHIGAKGLQG